jgi:hypothetical protein
MEKAGAERFLKNQTMKKALQIVRGAFILGYGTVQMKLSFIVLVSLYGSITIVH